MVIDVDHASEVPPYDPDIELHGHPPYIVKYVHGSRAAAMNEWELQHHACRHHKLPPPPRPESPAFVFGWRPEGWVEPPADELAKITLVSPIHLREPSEDARG